MNKVKVFSIINIIIAFLFFGVLISRSYQEIDVANGGAITGDVKFIGKPEALPPLKVTKDNNVCGSQKPSEELIVSKSGGVKNTIITIEKIEKGKKIPKEEASITNQNCQYIPHVQAMVAGNFLNIINSDPILHNTHGYLNQTETTFNLALPIKDQKIKKKIKKIGIMNIMCDAGHTWMSAYIAVTENPYYAVTGDNGTFEIADIPAGKYQLKAWHEKLGTQVAEVTVTEKGKAKVVFDKLKK